MNEKLKTYWLKGILIGANIAIFLILLTLLFADNCKGIKSGICIIQEIILVINYFFLIILFKEINPAIEAILFFLFPIIQWSILGYIVGLIVQKLKEKNPTYV
jgi:hypothetical protein